MVQEISYMLRLGMLQLLYFEDSKWETHEQKAITIETGLHGTGP